MAAPSPLGMGRCRSEPVSRCSAAGTSFSRASGWVRQSPPAAAAAASAAGQAVELQQKAVKYQGKVVKGPGKAVERQGNGAMSGLRRSCRTERPPRATGLCPAPAARCQRDDRLCLIYLHLISLIAHQRDGATLSSLPRGPLRSAVP